MIAQILVADDDPAVRALLSAHLGQKGHRMLVVEDGFALAQKAAEHRPHLIISDIQMPGAYGSSAYQVLRKSPYTSMIPVLFMSGHPLSRLQSLLPKDPKTRFLQKPLDLDALDRLIAELLPLGGYCP
jgi:two-component system capsular synthesis sensor histidine kinase RcsC